MNKRVKDLDKNLLKKFFRNQCTPEEIERVLNWFQTEEGELYFTENLDRDMHEYADDDQLFLHPEIPSDKILQKIRRSKKRNDSRFKNHGRFWQAKVAVILLICALSGGLGYILFNADKKNAETEQEVSFRTISTQHDQHRLVSLSDGTQIRLNSNSTVRIPPYFSDDERVVTLSGEAWFDVAKDESRPFHIQAGQASIQVLGTEFNVKTDKTSGNVEVAVAEGKVSLNNRTETDGRAAILTKNTFAIFNHTNREILIEHTPVENYLSWISGKLYFYSEPLWVVSRYIERLYNVSFQFEEESLRQLPLSSNMAREDLTSVLDIISKTLGIGYTLDGDTVTWKVENINPQNLTQ